MTTIALHEVVRASLRADELSAVLGTLARTRWLRQYMQQSSVLV